MMPAAETVLHQDGDVTVTTTRLVVGATMYPVRGLTAVQGVTIAPSRVAAQVLALMAVVLTCLSVLLFASDAGSPLALALPVVLLGLSVVAFVRAKSLYAVRVWTAGGQVDAVVLRDWPRVYAIVEALHRAVSS